MIFSGTYGNWMQPSKPKTSAEKVKDLEAKNRKLAAEVAKLKEQLAALNQILGQ